MTDEQSTQQVQDTPLTASDYKDFSLSDMQILADYITKNSVPVNLTIGETQQVLAIYTNLINLTLYNLNLLRSLAGADPFPIPTQGDE